MVKARDTVTLVRVDDGPQGNPTGITVSSTEPSSKYTGMLWKCTGNISGKIKNATYRWNGSSWELYIFVAQNIDVANLFAQAITATNMTITGNSVVKGKLDGASGTFAGNIEATTCSVGHYANKTAYYGLDISNNNNEPDITLSCWDSDLSSYIGLTNSTMDMISRHGTEMSSIGLNGGAMTLKGNTIAINGTDWDEFVNKQAGYDWSKFNTENTSDTWVPVMNGAVVNHRVIPADAFTVSADGIFRKYGKVVMARFYGTSVSSLPWVPVGWHPVADISVPVTVLYNGNPYMAYVIIRTTGKIECTYYNYGSSKGTPASGSTVYGTTTWII